jgi:hypothetical protein
MKKLPRGADGMQSFGVFKNETLDCGAIFFGKTGQMDTVNFPAAVILSAEQRV